MTSKEFDTYYGFTATMTPEERFLRQKQITRVAKWNNNLDEDEPDWEGMKGEYPALSYDTSYVEEYDKVGDR